MVQMGYSGARGTLIYEKNLMSKISCQTPFKNKPQVKDHFLECFISIFLMYRFPKTFFYVPAV
jgi:hypothetical protein